MCLLFKQTYVELGLYENVVLVVGGTLLKFMLVK